MNLSDINKTIFLITPIAYDFPKIKSSSAKSQAEILYVYMPYLCFKETSAFFNLLNWYITVNRDVEKRLCVMLGEQ